MRPKTRSRVLWAVWMTGGGIAASLVVWALTESVVWALVALLASGPVLNALGQMVVQPARSARGAIRDRDRPR
jgi:hypothetical protein